MSDWEPQPQADEDDLEKAKEAVAGDVPMMSQPPDGSVACSGGCGSRASGAPKPRCGN
jgi:hypothetical protein